MNKLFTQVPVQKLQKNVFDLSHDRKFSGKFGELIPVMVMDLVPGDEVSIQTAAFIRTAPLTAPVMHSANVFVHGFFVPNRITWNNFEPFITGGETGLDATVWPFLDLDLSASNNGELADHLGLPVENDIDGTDQHKFSALPFAAYQMIYDEYYRDENLITKLDIKLIDGTNNGQTTKLMSLRKRAWQHDYFTSSLSTTQKGPEALLPLVGEAPIFAKNVADKDDWIPKRVDTGATWATDEAIGVNSLIDGQTSGQNIYFDINSTNVADLSAATSTSIIDLRRAFKLQEYLEKNARGGSRYHEWLKVHFGVISSDARLNRPEYLGGSSTPIKISEVLNTTPAFTGQTLPLGTMGGHAVSVGQGGYISYRAEEHGYIICIMSVMPKSAYQQGIPKHFLRSDKFDYFTPEFQHIGEQVVLQEELYVNDANFGDTFGYTPRYAEYKFINSSVHGDYRDVFDFWHMGRKFATKPALNQAFIEMDWNEIERIFAVQAGDDHLWCHVLNTVKARRPMSVYGEPKF